MKRGFPFRWACFWPTVVMIASWRDRTDRMAGLMYWPRVSDGTIEDKTYSVKGLDRL